jgi:hypothetical protein
MPTIPQPFKCDVRKSKAGTTKRIQTKMEAQGTAERDKNEDGFSWQDVGGRGKKIASPRATRVTTLKRIKIQRTNNIQTLVTTTKNF